MKYRYIIVADNYDFEGTNDLETAQYWSESCNVVDCVTGRTIDDDEAINEASAPPEDDPDSELPDDEDEAAE